MTFWRKNEEAKKDKEFVGEVLVGRPNHGRTWDYVPVHNKNVDTACLSWKKFKESDINYLESHDGFIKIGENFYRGEDVLFYETELFKEFKNSVQNRYLPKEKS